MASAMLLFALIAADPAWQDFSAWFSREGIPGAPESVLKAYAAKLKSQGLGDGPAEARVKEVQGYLAAHPKEALTLHFNRIYTWKDAPFSREPSAFLVKVASTRKAGRALDVAMGQGRNSIWLAKAGWAVSGYDLSDEALRQANALGAEAGVKLDTKRATHEEYELGESQWDLIVMSFAFTDLRDAAYMQKVRDALKPGGLLVVDGFGGGPRAEANPLLKTLMDYRVLVFEELPDVSDWGRMKAPLLRMALEKP